METTSDVRFRLLERLGQTPACQVWRAHDAAVGRDVAVKVLDIRSADDHAHAQRFMREAQVAAKLVHPHIVGALGSGLSDDRPYLTMPLMERDLRAAVADGPLSVERAVEVVDHVAAALDAAHRAGLVHGDVKPSNVLFDGDDAARLGDFGAARRFDKTDEAITSWAYYAPEYLTEGRCDARTDVYALAGVLYFCLTGRDPFTGSVGEQIRAHRTAAPPRPSEVRPELPGALDAVVATGMAKDPEQRYPTARALAGAVRRISPEPQRISMSTEVVRRAPATVAVRATPLKPVVRRPRRLVYGGSAMVLAAVTAIAGVMTYAGREHTAAPAVFDGTYRAVFGSTLTLGGAGPSEAGRTRLTATIAVRSTCATDGCVAVATVTGDPLADSVEPRSATSEFVLDAVDGAWVSVASVPDAKGTEQWRVLSLRQSDDGGFAGTYSYVGDGRGAQRPVTFGRTGDVGPGQGAEDPATLPPRTRSPAQGLRGEYAWTRSAVNTTAGTVDQPVEVVLGLKAFTNCLRTGERCFSMLTNHDGVGVLLTYATGAWTSRSERDMRCPDGGSTHSVRTFQLPMPTTVPDPIPLLEGQGHMENTGDCTVSTDTEVGLQRSGS